MSRIHKEIEIPFPTLEQRVQFLKTVLKSIRHCLTDDDLEVLAILTEGKSLRGLKHMVEEVPDMVSSLWAMTNHWIKVMTFV